MYALLLRFAKIKIYALFKESYRPNFVPVGKLYVFSALEKIFLFRCGRPPLPTSPMETLAVLAITTTAATLTTRRRDLGNLSYFWSKSLLNQCLGATQLTQTNDLDYVMYLLVWIAWIQQLREPTTQAKLAKPSPGKIARFFILIPFIL